MSELAVWQRTIVDEEGNIVPLAEIEVRHEHDDSLATIYADRDGGTGLNNPFTADAAGFARFYAEGGAYKVTATGAGSAISWRFVAVGTLAERDRALFESASEVESARINPGITAIRTNGYTTPGDGGGALYKRAASEPSHNSKVQSADGSWWEPVVPFGYTFDSVSDMQASRLVTPGARVRTLGYYSPGDGGGNDYEIVAVGTGTDDGGSFIDLSGSGLQAKGLFTKGLNVLQFGADPLGVNDSAESINNAISYAAGAISKNVHLLSGEYRVSSTIRVMEHGIGLIGESPLKTRILYSGGTTGDIIKIGDGTEIRHITLSNFSINSEDEMTAGAAIRCTRIARSIITRVHIQIQGEDTKVWDGLVMDRADNCYIENCWIKTLNDGFIIYGNTTDYNGTAEVYIGGMTRISGCGRDNVVIGGSVGGLKFDACDIIRAGRYGMRIDSSLTDFRNREIFLGPTCTVDSSTRDNIYVRQKGTHDLDISGTWIASAGYLDENEEGAGVRVTGDGVPCLKITGAKIVRNRHGGVIVNDSGVVVSGCFFELNGSEGYNHLTASTVAIRENCTSATVTGNTITRSGNLQNTSIGAGVFVDGYPTNVLVAGNVLYNNRGDRHVIFNADPDTSYVGSNTGYVTEKAYRISGTPDENGEYTFNHGLSSTPITLMAHVLGDTESSNVGVDVIGSTANTTTLRYFDRRDGTSKDHGTYTTMIYASFTK